MTEGAAVGHSVGANVAIEMAATRGFSGPLALLAPSFSRKDESMFPRVLDRLGIVFGHLPLAAMLQIIGAAMKRAGLSRRGLATCDEDGDVGDFDRSRGSDASLRAKRGVAVVAEPCVAEEAFDLVLDEAEPDVGVFGAHRFVGVLDLVGDGDPAAGPCDACHLDDHRAGVLGVVRTMLATVASAVWSASGSAWMSASASSTFAIGQGHGGGHVSATPE
jgi:hypothetical protein